MKLELTMDEFRKLCEKHGIFVDSATQVNVYLVPPFPQDMSPATRKEALELRFPQLRGLIKSDSKITAIKLYRDAVPGCSLQESKRVIEEAIDGR